MIFTIRIIAFFSIHRNVVKACYEEINYLSDGFSLFSSMIHTHLELQDQNGYILLNSQILQRQTYK